MTNSTPYLTRAAWVWAIIGAVLAGIYIAYPPMLLVFALAWWNLLRLASNIQRDLAESRAEVVG